MASNYATADFTNNTIEFSRYSGIRQEIDLNWLYDFVDTIKSSDGVGYDSKTGLTYVVLSGQVLLIDTSNPTSKQLLDKYQFVDYTQDSTFGGVGLKLKPVTGSSPYVTITQACFDIGVRTTITSLQKLNMLLVRTHSVQGATGTIVPAGSTLPNLTTPNQMYVELRWSPGSGPASLAIPANTWTTLPYNSIAKNRNFNVSNLGSSLAGGVGSIFLDMPGLYLITGGWRTSEQTSTTVNTTAIQVNSEMLHKDGLTNGSNNNHFTFLRYIYPEDLIAVNQNRARLLIQAFTFTLQNLATTSATLTDDREPPVWCHIAFLG
jgi:hypothetical protein